MNDKKTLRIFIKEKRKLLSINEINKLSNDLFNNFIKNINTFNINFKNQNIAGYFPIKNEISDIKILEFLKNKYNCNISLPKIYNNTLIFKKWNLNINELIIKQNKNFKLLELDDNKETIIPNILLIPSLVFDIYKNRIGYGKGYYDNYLQSNKNSIKIGICYDFQIYNEEIENNINDIKMNYVISDKKIIK